MIKVYVLRSLIDGRYYVGMTDDENRRLKEHNRGKMKSTKGYRPWEMLETEDFNTRQEARIREKYLKSGVGKEYIKSKWSRSSIG